MKNYLDLVGITAKVHKKQGRMTKLCIILSVFLVTVILGMANEAINCQINQEISASGNWHCMATVSKDDAKLISMRSDVHTAGICVLESGEDGVKLNGNKSSLSVLDKNVFTNIFAAKITEGNYPTSESEVLLSENTKKDLNLSLGDTVKVTAGEKTYQVKISGFIKKSKIFNAKDTNAIIFDSAAYSKLLPEETKIPLMVRFKDGSAMKNAISEIKKTYSLSDNELISNGNLLALLMQSDNSYVKQLYLCAVVLSLIVLIAGIMMITSSININVSQKTEFFGMMRCLGAEKKQVKRFVIVDALGYCKTAVPIGLVCAVVVVWLLCAALRIAAPGIFDEMPFFDVSWISIIFGAVVGVLTVLLAAMSPARKASKVSPLTAVSGNAENQKPIKHAVNTKLFKVETVLGIHHATGSKKNFVLMICSFALSIILFLGFTVAVDFMNHAVVPVRPYAADIVVSAKGNAKLTAEVINKIKSVSGVTKVYPRMQKRDVPITVNGKEIKVDIISYEAYQFDWASRELCGGSMSTVENGADAMLLYNDRGMLKLNDTVTVKSNSKTVKIAAKVSSSQYNTAEREKDALIVSEKTFTELTGISDYTLVNVQQSRFADSKNAEKISDLLGGDYVVSDRIQTNKDGRGAYYSFAFFVYGFLAVIALIAVANIINSVAMSVNSRKKQYGFMRAVGMSDRQMLKMIVAQTLTYSLCGCIVGSIPGIFLNRVLYENMITAHWGSAWPFPTMSILIIVILLMITSIIAVYNPYKYVKRMSIIKNISNE